MKAEGSLFFHGSHLCGPIQLLHSHGPGERVELGSLGCAIEVDRVYADVLALGSIG